MKINRKQIEDALLIGVGWITLIVVAILLGGALATLTGCTNPTQDVYTPQEVDVPVSVPCKIQKPAAPDWALQHVALTDTLTNKVKGALSEIEQHKGYEDQLNAAIDGCQ